MPDSVILQIDSIDSMSIRRPLPNRATPLFHASETTKRPGTRPGPLQKPKIALLFVVMTRSMMVTNSGIRGYDRTSHDRECNNSEQEIP